MAERDRARVRAQAAAGDDAHIHAGVAVLGNRALFMVVTDFMMGYPYAVHKFYSDFHETFLLHDKLTASSNMPRHATTAENDDYVMQGVDRSPPCFKRDIVLSHLAITANDAEMLRVLYKLSKQPHRHGDPKLSFAKAMYIAVLFNRVEMLECIVELKAKDPDWKWEQGLLETALRREDPDMRMLKWLDAHLPPDCFSPSTKYLERPTQRGDLALVRWLRVRGCRISRRVIDEAARRGHVHLLQFFYNSRHEGRAADDAALAGDAAEDTQEQKKREYIINAAAKHGLLEAVKLFLEGENKVETPFVIDHAAKGGHLNIVKYLHENHLGGCTDQAMSNAAAAGHLDIMEFLHENRTEGCVPDAMDRAARNGRLEAVKFLHCKYAFECSTFAMDRTARNGHLEVLKFLHENRIGTCSTEAMDGAASKGHLEIVKFLHENRSEGCTTRAMDKAAEKEHLEVVAFLNFNRSEGCTANALSSAIRFGRCDVVELLLEHRSEVDHISAFMQATSLHQLEIVQLLRPKLQPGEMVAAVVEATSQHRFWTSDKIWTYLRSTQQQEPMGFLKHAVANGSLEVVKKMWEHSTVDELIDAQQYALELNKPALVSNLEARISKVLRLEYVQEILPSRIALHCSSK